MGSGGARNRSGPGFDPNSGRSDQRQIVLSALPPEGYTDDAPDFPLPMPCARELELWEWVWTYPQAHAWAAEPWRWYTVAEWVRWSVKAEDPDAPAAVVAAKIRMADQIGLTPAGLKENGWAIAESKPAATEATAPAVVTDIRTRLSGGS